MNFIKRFLGGGTQDKVEVLKSVKALLLPTFVLSTKFLRLVSSSCSIVRLAKELPQEFC